MSSFPPWGWGAEGLAWFIAVGETCGVNPRAQKGCSSSSELAPGAGRCSLFQKSRRPGMAVARRPRRWLAEVVGLGEPAHLTLSMERSPHPALTWHGA